MPAAATGVVSDVRPGSLAWMNGVRVGDSYAMLGGDWSVEVHTAGAKIGLSTALPSLPPAPAIAAAILLVVATLARKVLPAFGALLILGTVLVAGEGLLGWLPMPWLVAPVLAPFAAIALLAVERRRAASRLAGPALMVVAVASLLVAGLVFAAEPPFEALWQTSRLLPLGVAAVLALETFVAVAVTLRRAHPSRVPAHMTLVRSTAIGQRALRLAEEDERDRCAQRIHDRVIPGLALAVADAMSPTQARAVEAITDGVRATIMDDQLLVLREGGLAEAIKDAADRSGPGGPRTSVVVNANSARPPWDVEVAAFRIAQEAINNVRRHAVADILEVRIETHARRLRLDLVDDGVGIDQEVVHGRAGHLGIRAMETRGREVGGLLTVGPAGDRGTRVTFRWPT